MPTISIFFGIVVQMYWNDHNPPHLHAIYQGNKAIFEIRTGELLGGSMPPASGACSVNGRFVTGMN
jgi:hypothetical protein